MLDRANILQENFITAVEKKELPEPITSLSLSAVNLSADDLIELFTSQITSRHLDLAARRLKQQNQAYYTIGSSGHEGNAAIAKVFQLTDMPFLHYRSGAFMLQRARCLKDSDPILDHLLAIVAAKDDPIAAGRHKVFGSKQLQVPPQTSTVASHLPKAVGAAFSIKLAKQLNINSQIPDDGVVLCSFGDASVNHSTAQGAFNTARWLAAEQQPLPIVFICEDNGFGISARTPKNWIESVFANYAPLEYIQADGLNLLDVYRAAQQANAIARNKHKPVFLHMRCVRLLGHAGTDIEQQYKSQAEIEAAEANDPLLHTARIILENKIMTNQEIITLYQAIEQEVIAKSKIAVTKLQLGSAKEIMQSIIPQALPSYHMHAVTEELREKTFAKEYKQLNTPRNLCQNINLALTDLMLQQPQAVIFGEDVGVKGGVYRVTSNLQARFGKRRVFDTLLDEQTILGTAIGMAQNGFLPIPEIQYLAFLHNAEDQIRGEAATLSFFSNQQFTNPMVIRIAGLAYQHGFGGHFHNDNSIAVLRDIPGIIVACPSNGADAVKMLRTCVRLAVQDQRVVVFLEPIGLYMKKDLHVEGDQAWLSTYPELSQVIEYGELGEYGISDELTILTYANGYYLSRQAHKILQEQYNINIRILDLRWLVPLNIENIVAAIGSCPNILVIDECRNSGSVSEGLTAGLLEKMPESTNIQRLTAKDSFVTLGESWQHLMPSTEDIVNKVREILN